MTDTIAVRVARGAALLDEREPGWWQRIDLGELDMGSSCDCVLGQLWAPRTGDSDDWPYDVALDDLGLEDHADKDLGFNLDPKAQTYAALDAAWRELIESRRAGTP